MQIGLVFPHQLYKNIKFKDIDKVYLLEDPLFFFDSNYEIKFHKLKLVLHRASMKQYEEYLKNEGYKTEYIEFIDFEDYSFLKNAVSVQVIDPTDFMLEKRIKKFCRKNVIAITWIESPNFLTSKGTLDKYTKENKKYFHKKFYEWQRKRLNILIDENGEPFGGKWSYDNENREKLPKDYKEQEIAFPKSNKYIEEAIEYVNKNFKDHPGNEEIVVPNNSSEIDLSKSNFIYPTNFKEAEKWLDDFIENRLDDFGTYEDAIHIDFNFINHSLLSPILNIGLLDPKEVVEKILSYFQSSHKKEKIINSVEGFIRQIIGWREFMRMIYLFEGVNQRNSNFFNHRKRLKDEHYEATTEIEPIDNVIKNLNSLAYSHHIERLMVIGNYMLLTEMHPNEVYKWFMEMYIDSYDWVMVPNVYGMSQFADGGKIVTKPYVSGSSYILKMSNYKKSKDSEWQETWDGLFWRFLDKHQDFLKKNARMGMLINQLKKKSIQDKIKNVELSS